MPRDPRLRLEDILEACQQIESYLDGYDDERFENDEKTRDAVIRQFEIIGEAVKALPPEMTALHSDVPWRAIAGFRDVLAHSYFAVDPITVWDAATSKLGELISACRALLDAAD